MKLTFKEKQTVLKAMRIIEKVDRNSNETMWSCWALEEAELKLTERRCIAFHAGTELSRKYCNFYKKRNNIWPGLYRDYVEDEDGLAYGGDTDEEQFAYAKQTRLIMLELFLVAYDSNA